MKLLDIKYFGNALKVYVKINELVCIVAIYLKIKYDLSTAS